MLLKGSVLVEVILILLSARSNGQEYDVEEVASYDSEGDEHEHPDYSKYYSVDTGSTSPENAGFVGSGEFFSPSQPIIFGESNKKTISTPSLDFQQTRTVPQTFGYFPVESGLRDFFEEAQKKEQVANQQRVNEEFIAPGPNYISHSVLPLKLAYGDDKDEVESRDDVERIPPRPNKPKEEKEEDDEYYKPSKSDGYNIDKSHYPSASGLSEDHLGPYRKYSFQPKSKDFIVPSASNSDLKGCRRVDSPSDSDNMNCFICEDEANNSKYTQCSYKSKQAPEEYYTGNSERYSVPEKPSSDGFRYKRYARKSHDPYDVVRERSRKALEESHVPEELRLDFQYEPESYDETNPEISYSEREAEETKKNPENCKKVDKGGMTCTICHNPKSGGNYEQCSYTSEPSEKKYAYVTEKKYDSDNPEESKVSSKTEQPVEDKPKEESEEESQSQIKPKDIEGIESYDSRISQDDDKAPRKREEDSEESKDVYDETPKEELKSKLVNEENYDVPTHFSEHIKSEPTHHEDTRDESDNSDFDEYHFKLFPELRKKDAEEEEEEDEGREYHTPEATKHNVEEVLAEFSKKDRSTCKKAEKNGMTCFLCLDSNNIQHEECMYVQESRPQSKHVAYHEVKAVKDAPPKETIPEESKVIEKPPQETTLETAASEEIKTTVPFTPKKRVPKKKRSPKKTKKGPAEAEPTLKTPTEFEVADEEGAFSAETRPVYSKLHGVKLPEYMLAKSGFEREFDEFAGSF